MNRIIKLGCIASGMLAMLVSCQKENISSQEKGIVNISIRAIQDDETKTSLTAEGVKWNPSGEKLSVFEKAGSNDPTPYTSSDGVTTDGGATMTFGVSLEKSSESSFNYYALYPSSANKDLSSSNKALAKVELSSTQTPSATSFDGTKDILIAKAITGLNEQPTELEFAFKRMIAVGKMKISNLNSTENVLAVSFKATGKILSGRSYLNVTTGQAEQYGYYNPQDNVVLDYSGEDITANGMTAYFCVWPFSVAKDEEISVTVTTDSKEFTKVITSPRDLTFTEGKITSFTVDFDGIVGADNVKSYPFSQSFNNTKGDFVIEDITIPAELSYVWSTNSSYIKASAYNSTAYEAESQLVSPVIDMSGAINPVLKFFNVARFGTDNSNQLTLWVRENDGAWEQKEFSNYGDGSSWTMVSNTIDVSAYKGKTLQFAFKYTSSTTSAPTWEIQKVYVDEVPTLSSIAWSGYTTTYSIGETFKKDGKVLATYSDGDVIDVTSEAVFSDPDMSSAGDKVVTVTYGGKSTTGTITVNAAGTQNGSILFGTNNVKINSISVSFTDNLKNSWIVSTEGTTSFTPQPTYSQIGASSKPATSITFVGTLPASKNVKSVTAKFGGFSGTAGNISIKVGDIEVGTGDLSGTTDVTVESTKVAAGETITITITGIAKGVKAYSIEYSYTD